MGPAAGAVSGKGEVDLIRTIDKYIGKTAILGILLVWSSLTVLMMMFSILGELRDTTGNYGASDVFWFVLQTGPRMAYQIFPVSALMGSLLGIGSLASANELVAFRVSGASRLRLAIAGMAGTLIITVPVMAIGEWVAPDAEQQARAFRSSQLVGQVIIGGSSGMWIRDGNNIVNIRRPLLTADRGQQSINFQEIEIHHFGGFAELQKITRAESAFFDGDQWTLEGVSIVEISQAEVTPLKLERTPWVSGVKPELVEAAVTRPVYLSIRALWDQLNYLQSNGLDDRIYLSAFWEKVLYPLAIIALVMAGMPFVFGSSRQHNHGFRLFIGMTLGGVFMLINSAAQNLATAYSLPVALSTAMPSAVLMVIAVTILRRSA
ncbi:MAG: LPS export ABC transporter permease LptG [Xanthomonadales bacterium]|nr:LPS export ABC transporter permease LptG [Xanthomonadales bacterium]